MSPVNDLSFYCHFITKSYLWQNFLGLRWRRRSAAVTPRLDQLTNMHRVTMLLGSHHLVPRQLKLLLLEGERFLETLAPEKSFRSGPLYYIAQTKRCTTAKLLSKIVQILLRPFGRLNPQNPLNSIESYKLIT